MELVLSEISWLVILSLCTAALKTTLVQSCLWNNGTSKFPRLLGARTCFRRLLDSSWKTYRGSPRQVDVTRIDRLNGTWFQALSCAEFRRPKFNWLLEPGKNLSSKVRLASEVLGVKTSVWTGLGSASSMASLVSPNCWYSTTGSWTYLQVRSLVQLWYYLKSFSLKFSLTSDLTSKSAIISIVALASLWQLVFQMSRIAKQFRILWNFTGTLACLLQLLRRKKSKSIFLVFRLQVLAAFVLFLLSTFDEVYTVLAEHRSRWMASMNT